MKRMDREVASGLMKPLSQYSVPSCAAALQPLDNCDILAHTCIDGSLVPVALGQRSLTRI